MIFVCHNDLNQQNNEIFFEPFFNFGLFSVNNSFKSSFVSKTTF